MHDFSCKNPADMHYKLLADRTRYFKENEKGVAAMCKIMEELINSELKKIALRMLEDGIVTKEEIVKYFGLTLVQVEELSNCRAVSS